MAKKKREGSKRALKQGKQKVFSRQEFISRSPGFDSEGAECRPHDSPGLCRMVPPGEILCEILKFRCQLDRTFVGGGAVGGGCFRQGHALGQEVCVAS